MVIINDKISLIIEIDRLFDSQNSSVQDMINGDTYRINDLYKNGLNFIRENINCVFYHTISEEIMTLKEWMEYYTCNINNPKDISIFLRLATQVLTQNF